MSTIMDGKTQADAVARELLPLIKAAADKHGATIVWPMLVGAATRLAEDGKESPAMCKMLTLFGGSVMNTLVNK